MKVMVNKLIKNNLFWRGLIGIFVVVCVYITFGLSTIDYKGDIFKYAHIIMCSFSVFLYYVFDRISYDIEIKYKEIYCFNIFLALVTVLLAVSGIIDGIINGFHYYLISKFIFAVFFVWLLHCRRHYKFKCSIAIKEYIGLIIIIIVSLILMYNPYIFAFKWDGLLYNEAFENANLFKISSMGFYGHISQGAGVPISFFKSLVLGNTDIAIYLTNAVTFVAGIISFWGIIRRVVPEKSIFLYTILTAIYAWSPWVLGMSGYASVDYFTANWFMIVLYFTISKQYFLQVVSGLFYAMTKEPALIIYGSLCFGVVLTDIYENRRVKHVFSRSRYYGMLSVAAIWLITLEFMGMWSMPGSEARVDLSYSLDQVGILYVFNFGWLVWEIVLVGVIAYCFRRNGTGSKYNGIINLFPMICAVFAFSLFSLMFVTVHNPRYVDIVPLCGYVMVAVIILIFSDKMGKAVSIIIGTLLALLMLVSSYVSIDPVSRLLYYDEALRDTVIFTADLNNHTYGDATVYNKQALDMEGSISLAFGDAIGDKRKILIDGKSPQAYYFDGMIGLEKVLDDDYKWVREYFDTEREIRVFKPNDRTVTVDVGLVSNLESVQKITADGGEYIYLYYAGMGDALAEELVEDCNVIEIKEYIYRGWRLKGIVFNS